MRAKTSRGLLIACPKCGSTEIANIPEDPGGRWACQNCPVTGKVADFIVTSVYRICGENDFRIWDSGVAIIGSGEWFEGVYTMYGQQGSGMMRTWIENGERAYTGTSGEVSREKGEKRVDTVVL